MRWYAWNQNREEGEVEGNGKWRERRRRRGGRNGSGKRRSRRIWQWPDLCKLPFHIIRRINLQICIGKNKFEQSIYIYIYIYTHVIISNESQSGTHVFSRTFVHICNSVSWVPGLMYQLQLRNSEPLLKHIGMIYQYTSDMRSSRIVAMTTFVIALFSFTFCPINILLVFLIVQKSHSFYT